VAEVATSCERRSAKEKSLSLFRPFVVDVVVDRTGERGESHVARRHGVALEALQGEADWSTS
jgi:hypothetical protein